MNRGTIQSRLTALEKALSGRPIPSYEEWVQQWENTDELSQQLFIVSAENLDEVKEDEVFYQYMKVIREYLLASDLIHTNAKTLQEIAAEMESENE